MVINLSSLKKELQNLNEIAESTKLQIKENINFSEVNISDKFKNLYSNYLEKNGSEITFFNSNSIYKNSSGQIITFPNNWFLIAYFSVPLYTELKKYKEVFNNIFSNQNRSQKEELAKLLFNIEKVDEIPNEINNLIESTLTSEKDVDYFKRFLINQYKWWYGKKKIDRPDFFLSSILNVANLIHDSTSFIAKDLTKHLGENSNLYNAFDFLKPKALTSNIYENLVFPLDFPRNRILYGAPGTGKSYKLKQEIDHDDKSSQFRITFNPDMTYGQFVGTYKPVSKEDKDNPISYELVPGPFLNALREATRDKSGNKKNVVLVIEELNRANVSAVFGDVFQLLDRDDDGNSEYGITFSTDIMKWLVEKEIIENEEKEVKIPSNLFIWATMNSADQGVFPLDSAFKRRWTFEYVGIDNGESEIAERTIKIKTIGLIGMNSMDIELNWNQLRKALNTYLITKGINEDKLIGPFFLSSSEMSRPGAFEGKLLLYLWEDVLRHKDRRDLFAVNSLSEAHMVIKDAKSKADFFKIFTDNFNESNTDLSAADEEE